jgi:hypothetical protein
MLPVMDRSLNGDDLRLLAEIADAVQREKAS